MTFSYTQISHFLACPRRYRYRYLEGWEEKHLRASMLFGRAFEEGIAAGFRGQDCADVFYQEWSAAGETQLEYAAHDTWDTMLHQGYKLLELFWQQERIRIDDPARNLQVKVQRPLGHGNDFLGIVDAIAELDGIRCVIDWKTGSSRYPAQPSELLALDPQLICYSWLTGIPEVALVVFVRKRLPEIQYLHATISEAQRQEFGALVEGSVRQIEAAEFFPHSGIRFPNNLCLSCAFIGLCLNNNDLIAGKLARREGADLGWLDELRY